MVEEVHALGRVLVLGMLALIGCGVMTAAFAGRAARRKRLQEDQLERLIEELAKVNTRLNDVDERLVDMTLMLDETSRLAVDRD